MCIDDRRQNLATHQCGTGMTELYILLRPMITGFASCPAVGAKAPLEAGVSVIRTQRKMLKVVSCLYHIAGWEVFPVTRAHKYSCVQCWGCAAAKLEKRAMLFQERVNNTGLRKKLKPRHLLTLCSCV